MLDEQFKDLKIDVALSNLSNSDDAMSPDTPSTPTNQRTNNRTVPPAPKRRKCTARVTHRSPPRMLMIWDDESME